MELKKQRRNTTQRRIILEELRKLETHPTAAELYELVRRRVPRISLGTIYRNLELLERMGAVRKLGYHGVQARYDGTEQNHLHIQCLHCGRIDDLPDLKMKPPVEINSEIGGYRILGLTTAFVGICPKCKKDRGGRSARGDPAKHC